MELIKLTFELPDGLYCPECEKEIEVKKEDIEDVILSVKCSRCGELISLGSEYISCEIQ